MSDGTPAPELSLVIPCYNEEEVVESTLADLYAAFARTQRRLELVAVDNGSRDRTGEILERLARTRPGLVVVRVDVNQGYGNGILAGLPRASAPWVGFLCADGQVAAEDVAALFESATTSEVPRCFKVRRRFRRDGLKRKIVSAAYNLLMLAVFPRIGSIDVNGNPKILPREALSRMRLTSKDWFLDAEILLEARRLGLRVVERDVAGRAREGGVSNVRATTCLEFAKNILARRFGLRRGDAVRIAEPRTADAPAVGGVQSAGGARSDAPGRS